LTDIGIATGSPSWLRLARRAKLLATLTLVWLGIEGTVGVVAGISAGSIALVVFGLDSAIEGLASAIVIRRFTGTRTISESAERRAQKWVAVSFFLLAPYVAAEAIETLIEGAAAETSWLGIALTAGGLSRRTMWRPTIAVIFTSSIAQTLDCTSFSSRAMRGKS